MKRRMGTLKLWCCGAVVKEDSKPPVQVLDLSDGGLDEGRKVKEIRWRTCLEWGEGSPRERRKLYAVRCDAE
jgi:hypothetical protein